MPESPDACKIEGKAAAMLAFDIETTDIRWETGTITVASVYDPDRGISKNFNFCIGDREAAKQAFMQELDDAPSLCSFNGFRFDIPFIVNKFRVPAERYQNWFQKTFDYFEVAKVTFGSSCGLNKLLMANGEEVKTGSGLQAVQWAKEGEWRKLEEYCMVDTQLTWKISVREDVKLPLTNKGSVRCRHNPVTHALSFYGFEAEA